MKLRSGTNTSSMIGYKIAKAGETRVVITLEIPDDAVTNMSRKDIANADTAKYRTDKAKVLKIEDEDGKEYPSAKSFNYDKKSLNYVLNDVIIVDDYDMKLDEVCSTGIHFFLDCHCAEMYGLDVIQDGLYQSWHDNGQKYMECTYVNGKLHGLYQSWHANGQKYDESNYVNGELHGLYQSWYANGKKCEEYTFVNGILDGLFQEWYSNGQKRVECNYVNGQKHGLCKEWYSNGKKWMEYMYVNRKHDGLYQSWYENGEKREECTYVNGILDGLYQKWHKNGKKMEECMYVNGVPVYS